MQTLKNILVLVAFILMAHHSNAQITGKITNQKTEALPFVNVVLYRASDSSIITGTYSDENGFFSLNMPSEGTYLVGFSSIGYQNFYTKSIEMTPQYKALNLGNFMLLEDINALNELVITSKKDLIQVTPIGKIINVQASLMTKGSSALQVLERLPGVIVDRRNNNFSLNGQSGVSVLINGRSVQLSLNEIVAMLNGMSGDNIEKIELITSPTAQYDAQGGAGLINIILKKNENEGTNVHFSSTFGYGYREKVATSLSLTHGHKNTNYYASYAFLHDGSKSSWHADAALDIPAVGGFYTSDFLSQTIDLKNTHHFSVGFDHKTKPKTLFGGNLNYMYANTNPTVENDALYDFQLGERFQMKSISKADNIWHSVQPSLFFERQISTHAKLNFDANYLFFQNENPALISSIYFDKNGQEIKPKEGVFTDGNRSESISRINIGVFKIDFSNKINEKIHFDMGIKGSYAVNTNDSKVERKEKNIWVLDARSQSTLKGDEGILAAYGSFNFSLNNKTTLTTGMRFEYWERAFNTNGVQNKYAQLFPTVHFNHKIKENSSITLSANRRISRPAYNDLVSNLFYNDPTSVFTGNPLLKPSISNTFKVDYNVKGITIGLTLQNEENPIIRFQLSSSQAQDILILSPQNLDYQNSFSLNTNVPMDIFNWWKLTIGGSSGYRKYKLLHTPKIVEKAYIFHNYYVNQTFKLPKDFEIELSGWHNFDFFDGPNKIDGFGVANFGIAKKLKKEHGTIQLTVSDVFKSMNIYTSLGVVTPVVFIERSRVHYKDETAYSRIFRLSYSRSFGRKAGNRSMPSGSDEEKARVRQ